MPIILRAGKYKVKVFYNDHGGIHAHVVAPGGDAKVYLDGTVESTTFRKRSELKTAVLLVIENKTLIKDAWREYAKASED